MQFRLQLAKMMYRDISWQAPSGTNGYEANVQPEDDYGHSSPQPVKVKGFVGGVLPDKKSDHV